MPATPLPRGAESIPPASGRRRVAVLSLGDTEPLARRLAEERFPSAEVTRLDRTWLRRPSMGLLSVLVRNADDLLLTLPDLAAPRARLTTALALLPRARRRWLADAHGRFVPLSAIGYARSNAIAVAKHLLGCGLASVLARPTYALLAAALGRAQPSPCRPQARPRGASEWPPRRILYLRSDFWMVGLLGGGSVGHTAGVIGGLQQLGVDVRVVAPDVPRGASAPVTVVPPESWFDGRLRESEQVAYNLPFAWAAMRLAHAWRPDAIYQRFDGFNIAGSVLARMLGVPFVLEFNSSEVWKGEHWGGLHQREVARLGEEINLRAADRIVVVSRVLRDNLVARGVPCERIVVNPNGVDVAQFSPGASGGAVRHQYGIGTSEIVVGFSGTFGVWHGIPTLAAALPAILNDAPDVRVLLIGDGGLRPLVEQAVREHGLGERVVFTGLVPHEQMPGYLAACDVLLSPHGRQADGGEFFGSPTKLYEYMAMGKPIVASSVGQIGEVLSDGHTALLVPPDEPEALARATLRLVREPELRSRLGSAARREAEAHHTWQANARRVLDALAPTEAM